MAYNGSTQVISGLVQKNGLDFPIVDASAIRVSDSQRQSQFNADVEQRVSAIESEILQGIYSNAGPIYNILNNEYVTPEEYGAVGDGIHDDAPALQAALLTGRTVLLTQDLYCFSQVTVADHSFSLDGRGHRITWDYQSFLDEGKIGWSWNNCFRGRVFPLPAGETSDFYMVTGAKAIALANWYGVDTNYGHWPYDGPMDAFHFGYVSYKGNIPMPKWILRELENDPGTTITYYPEYSFKIHNTKFHFKNCKGIMGVNLTSFVNSEIYNVDVVCEVENNGDGKCGIRVEACSGVILDHIYVEGWVDRYTWDYMSEYGYGLALPSDNLIARNITGRNCRDYIACGGNGATHWGSRVMIQNAVLASDMAYRNNRPGWYGNRTYMAYNDGFECHGNCTELTFDHIYMNKFNITSGFEFSNFCEFRVPYVRVTNIECIGDGTVCFPAEYLDYIHLDNMFMPGIDVRVWFGAGEYKTAFERELLITNSLFKRMDDSVGQFMVHLVNCWVRERLWNVSNLKMEGCTVWADVDWPSMTTISIRNSLQMIDCDIYANKSIWTPPTTPLIDAPANTVQAVNCRFHIIPGNNVFLTEQKHIVNCLGESRFGLILRSHFCELDHFYPYPDNDGEEGMYGGI